MARKIYLGGPDVFLADAVKVGRVKVELCRVHGFEGLFPLDSNEADGGGDAATIFLANRALMSRADIGLFNLTPFRGPSADVGTVFELGFMHAQEKPIYGYSGAVADYPDRVATSHGPLIPQGARRWASDGYAVEDFGLADNLMIERAIRESKGVVTVVQENIDAPLVIKGVEIEKQLRDPLAAFQAFAECLEAVGRAHWERGVVRSGA